MDNAFTLYAVNLDKSGTGSDTFFDQLSDQSIAAGISEMLIGASGEVYNRFSGVGQQDPRISFTTSKLATALDAIGLNGVSFEKATGVTALDLFFQAYAQGGIRGGAGTNLKLTMNKGILIPRTLTADQSGPGGLELEAIPTWDGTNDIVSIAKDQDLVGSPDVDEIFLAGPVSLNGTSLDSVISINVDFGITLRGPIFSEGAVWAKFVAVETTQPRITITTLDLEAIHTLGISGSAQSATDSLIYLVRAKEGGTREANGESKHIKLAVGEGLIFVDREAGSQGSEGTADIIILPTYDGSNDPIVITTGSAIT